MRNLIAFAAVCALVAGCLPTGSTSNVNSGFTANDCTSLKAQHELQTGKLPELIKNFNTEYETYLAKQPKKDEGQTGTGDQASTGDGSGTDQVAANTDTTPVDTTMSEGLSDESFALLAAALEETAAPLLADASLTSGADCSKFPITGEPVYQACKEVFAVQEAALAAAKSFNDPSRRDNCLEGAGGGVKAHMFAYCDVQCSFGNADCTACSFNFKNALGVSETARMICSNESAAREAINGFCGSGNADDCSVAKCETNLGSFYAGEKPDRVIAGTNGEEWSSELSAYLGAYAKVDITAGVKTELEGVVKGTVGGKISIVAENETGAIRTQTDVIESGVDVACQIDISQIGSVEFAGKSGAGGSFKIFGNGAEASAGVAYGGTVAFGQVFTKKSPTFPGGGQQARVLLSQCMSYVRQWLGNDLIGHIRNREDLRILKEVINTATQQIGNDPLVTSAEERGRKAARLVYNANKTFAYYGACAADHNWAGIASKWLGSSAKGDEGCRTEGETESGKYKETFINTCIAELTKICIGS